jgi:hypothetical protein
MPPKGRPRLTEDDLEARIKAYCKVYGAGRNDQGLPEFPAGQRETPQHREWIALYKLWNRLGRRKRGQCDRCEEPASPDSIFCEAHRDEPASRSGTDKPSLEERRGLMSEQKGACPVCAQKLDLLESAAHRNPEGRALLHPRCLRAAQLAEDLGKEGVERLRGYLWPRAPKPRG